MAVRKVSSPQTGPPLLQGHDPQAMTDGCGCAGVGLAIPFDLCWGESQLDLQ